MKSLCLLIALAACATLSYSLAIPAVRDDTLGCNVCMTVVEDAENYEGDNLKEHEDDIIKNCEAKNPGMQGKIFCDWVVKNELENIEKQLKDPEHEKEDAEKFCDGVHICHEKQ
ncbi:unnamed protein product, partial [Mesorhabditis spiculigera]